MAHHLFLVLLAAPASGESDLFSLLRVRRADWDSLPKHKEPGNLRLSLCATSFAQTEIAGFFTHDSLTGTCQWPTGDPRKALTFDRGVTDVVQVYSEMGLWKDGEDHVKSF